MNGSGAGCFAAVGECMMEIAPAEGGLHRLGFAGDTFNTAWAARRLLPASTPVRYVTAVGGDWASDEMAAFMAQAGIDTDRIARDAGRSVGLYAIRLDRDGERSFSYWRKDSAATRLADDPAWLAGALVDASLVFFSGITLAILPPSGRDNLLNCLRSAREGGATIAFDPNFRARLWADADIARENLARAFERADIVLPTFGDEAELWGDRSPADTAERLLRCGVEEAVIKDGARPALLATPSGRSTVPAQAGVVPVDSTGAGDAFNGAYLAARMRGLAPEAAAARAHAAAAVAIRTRGALLPASIAQMA